MDDTNQQILTELRKIRKTTQWTSAITLTVMAIVVIYGAMKIPMQSNSLWSGVSNAMRQSDYSKALKLAQALTSEHPSDYYGHEYLGNIYMAMGDTAHAESEYSRAYELMPSEDIQKRLEAIRKRRDHDTQSQATPEKKP